MLASVMQYWVQHVLCVPCHVSLLWQRQCSPSWLGIVFQKCFRGREKPCARADGLSGIQSCSFAVQPAATASSWVSSAIASVLSNTHIWLLLLLTTRMMFFWLLISDRTGDDADAVHQIYSKLTDWNGLWVCCRSDQMHLHHHQGCYCRFQLMIFCYASTFVSALLLSSCAAACYLHVLLPVGHWACTLAPPQTHLCHVLVMVVLLPPA